MTKKYYNEIVEYAKSIQSVISEKNPDIETIASSEELEKFLEKEKLAKANMWSELKIIKNIAQQIVDGKRDIQFKIEDLPPDKKRKAERLILLIKSDIEKMKNPIYDTTYQTISKLALLIQLLVGLGYGISYLLSMGPTNNSRELKKKKFVNTVKKLGDPRKKTPKELMSFIKNVVSLIDKR